MSEYKLTIPGSLPGLNEYSTLERRNRYQAAAMKRRAEHVVMAEIRRQLRGLRIKKPVSMDYLWIEKDRRRDKDNIAFAKKFVQDALVKVGVLENDGWKQIDHFSDDFAVDAKRPRVEITIREVGASGKTLP